MMVFTTLFIAAIIILGLYFLLVRFLPWPSAAYLLMVGVGVACLLPGDVHFRYIGIEVAGIGSFLVWVHYRFVRPSVGEDAESNA